MKRAWNYLLAEPFTWMFYAFFQPRRLDREFGQVTLSQRVVLMLRVVVPMVLVSYPLALLGRAILLPFHLLLHPDIASILGEAAVGIAVGIAFGIAVGIAGGIAGGIAFIVFYFMGFFRMPFYLASGPSLLKAYRTSRKNPVQVFSCLQHSSLHWDEIVYLPLPYLKQTLLIAYDQDSEGALEEITFIAAERPQQLRAARGALLEIAVRDLETRKSFADIAEAWRRLDELFPAEAKLLDPQWATPVTRLHEASQDAARYRNSPGRRSRLEALVVSPDRFMRQKCSGTPCGCQVPSQKSNWTDY